MADANSKPMLSDEMYARLNAIVTLGLPALGTLFAAISAAFGNWEHTTAVLATLAAVATFLGVVLRIAQGKYDASDAKYDGEVSVTGVDPDTGIPNLRLVVTTDPEELVHKDTVKLRSSDLR